MQQDRIIRATENLRKALRALKRAHSPDRYDRLRAVADASLAAFYASATLTEEHQYQLRDLRDRLDHLDRTEPVLGPDEPPAGVPV